MPDLGKKGLHVLEPCAGAGILADRYSSKTGNKVIKSDIQSRRADIQEIDYMKLESYNLYDLIITNFPYNDYNRLVRKALNDVKINGYVAVLSRLSILESKQRYEQIYGHRKPEKILIFSRRLKCFKDKSADLIHTDKPFIWIIWHKDEQGFFSKETKLEWIY